MNMDKMIYDRAISHVNQRSGCLLLLTPVLALVCLVAGVMVRMDAVQLMVLLIAFAIAWTAALWAMIYAASSVLIEQWRDQRKPVQ